jgi:hypothetical protein
LPALAGTRIGGRQLEAAAAEWKIDGGLVPGLLQHIASAGGQRHRYDRAARDLGQPDNALACLADLTLGDISDHHNVDIPSERVTHGNQCSHPALAGHCTMIAATRCTNDIKSRTPDDPGIDFRIGTARDQRDERAVSWCGIGHQNVLTVPQCKDRRKLPLKQSLPVGRLVRVTIGPPDQRKKRTDQGRPAALYPFRLQEPLAQAALVRQVA